MSTAASSAAGSGEATTARPLPERAPRPTLRVLEGPVQRVRRIPFLVSCIVLLSLGLLSLLGLNIGLARGSYEVTMLQQQQQQLLETTQDLGEQLDTVSSPAMLSSRARAMGMIPSGAPAFLQLSDGRILGDPTAAVAPAAGTSVDLTRPSYPASPSAGASPSGSTTGSDDGRPVYPTYSGTGPASLPSASNSSSGSASPSASVTGGAGTSPSSAASSTPAGGGSGPSSSATTTPGSSPTGVPGATPSVSPGHGTTWGN